MNLEAQLGKEAARLRQLLMELSRATQIAGKKRSGLLWDHFIPVPPVAGGFSPGRRGGTALKRPCNGIMGQSTELWAGCVAGALTTEEYRRLLAEAGFTDTGLEVTRVFSQSDLPEGFLTEKRKKELLPYDGSLASAFVRARKPQ